MPARGAFTVVVVTWRAPARSLRASARNGSYVPGSCFASFSISATFAASSLAFAASVVTRTMSNNFSPFFTLRADRRYDVISPPDGASTRAGGVAFALFAFALFVFGWVLLGSVLLGSFWLGSVWLR